MRTRDASGVPLISSRGFVLGNLCVVGMAERTFSADEMAPAA